MFAQEREGVLIDGVEVGPFFAVDLDVDEEIVHQPGDLFVFEGFVGHDVAAPVAGGVADGQQDRLVAVARLGEGVGAPLAPIDRIVLVLEEIRARRVGELVCHDGAILPGWRLGPARGARIGGAVGAFLLYLGLEHWPTTRAAL